nr:probable inactive purple acid phosphatase 28 isoform X3 [Arachis hypogaea]
MDPYTKHHQNRKNSLFYLLLVLAAAHLLSRKLYLDGDETVRVKKVADLPLRFRSDGTFKILQVADMHYGIGKVTRCRDVLSSEFDFCSDLNTTQFLERIIRAENPDFIAFTGSTMANSSILNLFFLDSGGRAFYQGFRTYEGIRESQLNWLQGQKQDPLNPSEDIPLSKPPALAFFHIPIPEIPQLWYKKIVGQFQEAVACPRVNSGALKTFVSMGDVKAVFMGHDHTNDFCGNLDGIWFCYGGGFGYHAYGKPGWPRRARIIMAELKKGKNSWMGVERIKTWKRLDDKKLSKIDEQILWDQRLSR